LTRLPAWAPLQLNTLAPARRPKFFYLFFKNAQQHIRIDIVRLFMVVRLCWLMLAVFLASCSGGSDSAQEEPHAAATSTNTSTFQTPEPQIKPVIRPEFVSDLHYGPKGTFHAGDFRQPTSSKLHTIYLEGSAIRFFATAGHLEAETPSHGSVNRPGKAAIFYTAYTRYELPDATRPVTFIFNGGPGGASSPLDLDFLGPKRIDGPGDPSAPLSLADNPKTLLGKTDLVFVDPVGTGYSRAISPSQNDEFWSVDEDAEVLADFIIRYVNANKRQDSPKYLYGVSYGGIRVPIIGRMLIESGTAKYTEKKDSTNVLTGLILNSPALDYEADCMVSDASCAGSLPTYAAIAAYWGRSIERKYKPIYTIPADLKAFVKSYDDYYVSTFSGVDSKTKKDLIKWAGFLKQPEAPPFLNRLYELTGIGKYYKSGDTASENPWLEEPNMNSVEFGWFVDPGKDSTLLLADGRETRKIDDTDPAFDRRSDFDSLAQLYQREFIGYDAKSRYMGMNGEIIDNWDFRSHHRDDPMKPQRLVSSVTDLLQSLRLKPDLKVLVQHGYYDLNTPFYQSELVLAALPPEIKIPVETYEAGHGIGPEDGPKEKRYFYGEVQRDLKAFYDQPRPAGLVAAMRSPLAAKVVP
jgi:carboxypeptidase C (cathepsin A)